jgi:hypothetical protein
MNQVRLFWFKVVICCPEGDWLSISRCLLKDTLRQLRGFLLGESENVRFRTGENGLKAVYILNLTQTQWHKFARLLTARASYYRRWLQRQPGLAELCWHEPLDLDRTA